MLDKIKHPILLQGDLNRKNYFEGWYYKQVTADGKTSLSFIPGISLNEDDPHAFIQYIMVSHESKSIPTRTGYIRYPLESFGYQDKPFAVRIGNSVFSERMIDIDLEDEHIHFKGIIHLGKLHPIQTSTLQPNIMGIFAYIPKMECYHGVISMSHRLNGILEVSGQKSLNFNDGKGYIEKDWGSSFPKHYIWLHSNHFTQARTSLFFSVAHIPFYFTEFEGFICNFVYGDQEYRFASYNFSKCRVIKVTSKSVKLVVENKKAKLTIAAEVIDNGGLIAPVNGRMTKMIKEGISGTLQIELEDKLSGKIYHDIGNKAGVEIVDYQI